MFTSLPSSPSLQGNCIVLYCFFFCVGACLGSCLAEVGQLAHVHRLCHRTCIETLPANNLFKTLLQAMWLPASWLPASLLQAHFRSTLSANKLATSKLAASKLAKSNMSEVRLTDTNQVRALKMQAKAAPMALVCMALPAIAPRA